MDISVDELDKILKNGGIAEYSNWIVYYESGEYYADCSCCKRKEYATLKELLDDAICDIDVIRDADGNYLM